MENNLTQLLKVSAQIFEQLGALPELEKRMEFIEQVNRQLDERGEIIKSLIDQGFQIDKEDKLHRTLSELDAGIKSRLNLFMQGIKDDMKDLQNAKKNERQYMNPYSDVRVMDGMYYDKKK